MPDRSDCPPDPFNDLVIIRSEGDEYLLYNRATDQLLMLSDWGMKVLQEVTQTGKVEHVVKGLAEEDPSEVATTARRIGSLIRNAADAGILEQDFRDLPEIKNLTEREDLTHEPTKDLRGLGDLSLAAWAIAARSPAVR